MWGAVEAGGTKFVCAVGTGPDRVEARTVIPTSDPDTTLSSVVEFLTRYPIRALGVATFGPVELREGHPNWGTITSTPKPGWKGVNLAGRLAESLGVPVGIDTDVNGAALGEWRWGAGRGMDPVVYVTVGTGVGGGAVIGGRPLHGLVHPEMGHVSVTRLPGDEFAGICPFHGDCLEGMVSGPALERRFGRPPSELGSETEAAVSLASTYLARGLRQVVYVLCPEKIVLGGGVSRLPGLVGSVGVKLLDELAGYGVTDQHRAEFVVPPALGDDSGILGGFVLAEAAAGR
ncbi:MAG: fructokinase [Acidimicrobiia bacterium]|nr:MAG: fructokinase [Acidimicrobiia bacterium]